MSPTVRLGKAVRFEKLTGLAAMLGGIVLVVLHPVVIDLLVAGGILGSDVANIELLDWTSIILLTIGISGLVRSLATRTDGAGSSTLPLGAGLAVFGVGAIVAASAWHLPGLAILGFLSLLAGVVCLAIGWDRLSSTAADRGVLGRWGFVLVLAFFSLESPVSGDFSVLDALNNIVAGVVWAVLGYRMWAASRHDRVPGFDGDPADHAPARRLARIVVVGVLWAVWITLRAFTEGSTGIEDRFTTFAGNCGVLLIAGFVGYSFGRMGRRFDRHVEPSPSRSLGRRAAGMGDTVASDNIERIGIGVTVLSMGTALLLWATGSRPTDWVVVVPLMIAVTGFSLFRAHGTWELLRRPQGPERPGDGEDVKANSGSAQAAPDAC